MAAFTFGKGTTCVLTQVTRGQGGIAPRRRHAGVRRGSIEAGTFEDSFFAKPVNAASAAWEARDRPAVRADVECVPPCRAEEAAVLASALAASRAGTRPPVPAMIAFIDDHRDVDGVEPICRVLPIAPSTYFERVAQRQDPMRLSARAQRDQVLKPEVARVFAENFVVYGDRKVWRQMVREGFRGARCTVERLMRDMGQQGVIRGKPVRMTMSDKAAPCPLDHVNRRFYAPAPNMLWVSDFTYVAGLKQASSMSLS